jgi:hypothetical protein
MVRNSRSAIILAFAGLFAVLALDAAAAACTPIRTAADLDRIRRDLAGDYCLRNDIDLAGAGGFEPIGSQAEPFTGKLDGGGFVIRNLTINSARPEVGLFGWITGGVVKNLTLAGISVKSTHAPASVGGVTGYLLDGDITNVRVTGTVACTGTLCRIGGVAGETAGNALIRRTISAADVSGRDGGAAGGLAGQINAGINQSSATGAVRCRNNCAAGGAVGWVNPTGWIRRSFATGEVQGTRDGTAGGLAGYLGGAASLVFSLGAVSAVFGTVGGLAGDAGNLSQAFAAGRVSGGAGSSIGGLGALLSAPAETIRFSFWDINTTGRAASVAGTGNSTAVMQAALPGGFTSGWAITNGFSYPFFDLPGFDFAPPLATLVRENVLYIFLPLGQREPTEYASTPANADMASLAAVYTMLARAIGVSKNVAELKRVKIDTYFWNDANMSARWAGPVRRFANLGPLRRIGDAVAIGDANVIGPLKSRRVVVIRGSFRQNRERVDHWMLATLFRTNEAGDVTHLVAHDPWTGRQVLIDPATKRVVSPARFPLADFQVEGFQVVTIR